MEFLRVALGIELLNDHTVILFVCLLDIESAKTSALDRGHSSRVLQLLSVLKEEPNLRSEQVRCIEEREKSILEWKSIEDERIKRLPPDYQFPAGKDL